MASDQWLVASATSSQLLATSHSCAEASGITGGYTVPPDFYKQLLAFVEEQAIFRSRAFVQPMASATLQFPYLDITTVQAAGTSQGGSASAA